jgi:MFS family permease
LYKKRYVETNTPARIMERCSEKGSTEGDDTAFSASRAAGAMRAFPARAVGYASAAFGLQVFRATFVVFVPPMLAGLGATPMIIGAVMACDPAALLTIAPMAGLASDRLRTRLGGRLPIMLGSAALAALALAALGRADSLWAAAGLVVLTYAVTAAYWAPYRAVLADAFPPHAHALTSGGQSLARELGTLLTFGLGALAVGWGLSRFFDLAAAALLATTLWCALAVGRGAGRTAEAVQAQAAPAATMFSELGRLPRRLVAAQMLWWFAIEAAAVFAVLYIVKDVLGVAALTTPAGQAALATAIGALTVLAVAGVAASVPVALLAGRFGKLPVVRAGLVALLGAYMVATFATGMPAVYVVSVLFGVGFAVMQVLAFPLLLDLRPRGGGALASAYNLLAALPQLVALVTMGAIAQATGTYRAAFALGALTLIGALVLLHGLRLPTSAPEAPQEASPPVAA